MPSTLPFMTSSLLLTVMQWVQMEMSIHSTNWWHVERRMMREAYNLTIRRKWKSIVMMTILIFLLIIMVLSISFLRTS